MCVCVCVHFVPFTTAPERASSTRLEDCETVHRQRHESCSGKGLVAHTPCWSSEAWTGTRSRPANVHQTRRTRSNQPPQSHGRAPIPAPE